MAPLPSRGVHLLQVQPSNPHPFRHAFIFCLMGTEHNLSYRRTAGYSLQLPHFIADPRTLGWLRHGRCPGWCLLAAECHPHSWESVGWACYQGCRSPCRRSDVRHMHKMCMRVRVREHACVLQACKHVGGLSSSRPVCVCGSVRERALVHGLGVRSCCVGGRRHGAAGHGHLA